MRRSWILCIVVLLVAAAASRGATFVAAEGSSTNHRTHDVRAGLMFLFGTKAIQPRKDESAAGSAEAFAFRDGTTGMASAISVYVDSHNRAARLVVGLYSNRGRGPGRRLAMGSLAWPKAAAWHRVDVHPRRVEAGTTYWLVVMGKGGRLHFRVARRGHCRAQSSRRRTLRSLPAQWTSGSRMGGCSISAYVSGTYSTGGRPPTGGGATGTGTTSGSGFSPAQVSGAELLNASGQRVFLHGVNRAGTEYSCIHNTGFFDGTGTSFGEEDAQITSMAAWGINGEMITLNEDCWLGINGVPAAYSDSSAGPPTPGCPAAQCPYANAIENLVKTDEANDIYPVISLMFAAPGTTQASSHISLADNDHAPLFWEEVANFFKSDRYVMFRLEQEPTLGYASESDWQCWAQGDVSYSMSSVSTPPIAPRPSGTPNKCSGLVSYQTVGMQSLVNIIRGTGATNVIALPGLGYSNMVACGPGTSPRSCGMLDPSTPAVADPISPAQLMASVDVYPEGNTCGQQRNTSCYDTTYKPVAQVMPLIAGETAENPNNIYTPTTYVDMFLNWMDANGNGYFPYAWDPWADLIAGYGNNSSPSTVWGTDYSDHINHK